jgi:uncharacterized Tic20 family protein
MSQPPESSDPGSRPSGSHELSPADLEQTSGSATPADQPLEAARPDASRPGDPADQHPWGPGAVQPPAPDADGSFAQGGDPGQPGSYGPPAQPEPHQDPYYGHPGQPGQFGGPGPYGQPDQYGQQGQYGSQGQYGEPDQYGQQGRYGQQGQYGPPPGYPPAGYPQAGYDPNQPYAQHPYPPGQPPVQPYAGQPYGPGQPLSPSDEQLWSTLSHISIPFIGLIGPLVVYLLFKDRGPFIRANAIESLNFSILYTVVQIVCSILTVVVIGAVLLPIVGVGALVLCILAAISANKGEFYRYPVNWRLIK